MKSSTRHRNHWPHDGTYPTGNRDIGFQQIPALVPLLKAKFSRIEVLIDQETMVKGLRVWGSPYQPWYHDWAYNFPPGPQGEREAQAKWDEIPDDTVVLITHGPPHGILDATFGCTALKARIDRLPNLRLHVFGHIHEAHGTEKVGDVLYVNACTCDANFSPSQKPIVVDIDEASRVASVS